MNNCRLTPRLAQLGTVNRLLLPEKLQSVKDIRTAAASIHADILLLYTFDTDFRVRGHEIGPLSVFTLGFAPNKEARVTTTASGVFYDVFLACKTVH